MEILQFGFEYVFVKEFVFFYLDVGELGGVDGFGFVIYFFCFSLEYGNFFFGDDLQVIVGEIRFVFLEERK